jgi:NitT/TauT family transport system substrate-binding protein
MKKLAAFAAILVALALAASGCGGSAEGDDLGSEGKPVHLTVGYQPYYSEAWSALVLKNQELWKEYLPEGSTVEFEAGLQGSILVSQMLAGKEQIGYMGDMPAIVGVSQREVRDLRIVANVGNSADQCGVLLVNNDAPEFKSAEEAVKWMDGKAVATPQGSCADRVAQSVFKQGGVEPKSYLNQTNDLITTDFQSGNIDAAATWEPNASKLVNDGLAKRVASGAVAGETTSAFLVMSKELIDSRPDVAKGWLEAELAAERFMADPANAEAITKMAFDEAEGFTDTDMHDALFKSWPTSLGGAADGVKLTFPFVIDPATEQLVDSSTQFLFELKSLASADLPEGAVDGTLAAEVLGSETSPVGEIKGS